MDVFETEEKNWAGINIEQQGEYVALKAGTYQCVIKNVETVIANSGLNQLKWELEVIAGENCGKRHYFRTPLEGQWLSITKNAVWACGLFPETMQELKRLIQKSAFTGLVIEIKITEKDSTYINKVFNVEANSSTPTTAAAPAAIAEKPSTSSSDEPIPWK